MSGHRSLSRTSWLLVPCVLAALAACGDRIGLHQSTPDDGPTGTTVGGGEPPSLTNDGGLIPPPFDAGAPAPPRGDGGYVPDTEPTSGNLRIDAAHSAHVDDATLVGPLLRLWSQSYPAALGYPLIARGLVVVAYARGSTSVTTVTAHHARTGAVVWSVDLPGASVFADLAGLAYDGGRIFVVSGNGAIHALDVASGLPVWSIPKLDQPYVKRSPAAYEGTLYVVGSGQDGTLYAIDESNGTVLTSTATRSDMTPAISDRGIFLSVGCQEATALDLFSQAVLWHHIGSCSGGSATMPVLGDDLLYVRDHLTTSVALLTSTGGLAFQFPGQGPPAFHGTDSYFLQGTILTRRDRTATTIAWTFTGDNNLATAPIVVGGRVFVGSSLGTLFGVDESTGMATFSDAVGTPFSAFDDARPVSLAAAGGVLAVPNGSQLFVYGAPDPGDGGVD